MTQGQQNDKILVFLDIDGVLACTGYALSVPEHERHKMFNRLAQEKESLNPVAFGLLNSLFTAHDALHLVCSSVWRKAGKDVVEAGLRAAHAALIRATQAGDIPYALRWHDVDGQPESWRTAPTWEADHPRGQGVVDYIRDYRLPADQKIILIDDSADYLPEQIPYCIRTDSYAGFTLREYIAMEALINRIKPQVTPQAAVTKPDSGATVPLTPPEQ